MAATVSDDENMEGATFRKWPAEHGCRFDTDQEQRGTAMRT
jgi:hypothetical protein